MRWPKLFRREPRPWTPGRVVDLFSSWETEPGTLRLVSVAGGGEEPALFVKLTRRGTKEEAVAGACLCPACLASQDFAAVARAIREGLVEALASEPFEFKGSAPAEVRAN